MAAGDFWDNPEGNPTPPDDGNGDYTTPWKRLQASRRAAETHVAKRQDGGLNPSPAGIFWYNEPIQYLVRKTGYYCVGTQAVTRDASRHSLNLQPSFRSLWSPVAGIQTPTHPDKNPPTFLTTLTMRAPFFSKTNSTGNYLRQSTRKSM